MSYKYTIVTDEDDEGNVTVFFPDGPLSLHTSHGNYKQVVVALLTEDESVDLESLFDKAQAIRKKFERLSERVTVSGDEIYFDGDPVKSVLADHIVRFLDEGVEDWQSLVLFLENIQQNPNEHSREMLYKFLCANDFTTDEMGYIVAYKGCRVDDDGIPTSIHKGPAIVDGEEMNGYIPNRDGSVIEMPRSEVVHDPYNACSTGLHVGTHAYASSYNQGAMLEVRVNPRDVVSVPNDAGGGKVRVCRYEVVSKIDAPYQTSYVPGQVDDQARDWYDEDEERCEDCGDRFDDCRCDDECIYCGELLDKCVCDEEDDYNGNW